MKKLITSSLLVFALIWQANAQTLNQNANWPNTSWTITGIYSATDFAKDPTTDSNFSYCDNTSGINYIAAESPIVDLTPAYNAGETWIKVSADYTFNKLYDLLEVQYYDADSGSWVSWNNGGFTDNTTDFLYLCGNTTTQFKTGVLDISGFTSTQLSGFRYRVSYDDFGLFVYGFCISSPIIKSISCPAPSGLGTSNVTTFSADLEWTDISGVGVSHIEYGLAGFVQGSGTTIVDNDGVPSETISGLTPGTNYEFYVRARCSIGDFSTWTGPFAFTTCATISTFPWTEDFETVIYPALPNCWTAIDNNNNGSQWTSAFIGGATWAAGLFTDGKAGANDDYLVLPPFALTGGQQLKFDVRVKHASQPNDYRVVLSTTGKAPADFTTQLLPLTVVSSESPIPVTLDLSAYTGTVYIAIHVPSGGLDGFFLYVDNFTVENIPCTAPSNLTTANITDSTADLSWTENGTASLWKIEYGFAGFTPGSGTILIDGGGTPDETLTGLSGNTPYEFYVSSLCGPGIESPMAGPVAFTTQCNPFGPFAENFNNSPSGNLPDCWNEIEPAGTNVFIENQGSFNHLAMENNGNNTDLYAITPPLADLPSGNYQIRFRAFKGSVSGSLKIGIMTDPANPASFSPVQTISLGFDPQEYLVQFDNANPGTSYVAFKGIFSSAYGFLYINDVVWEPIPACQYPLNFSIPMFGIEHNSASFVWNTVPGVAGYNWSVFNAGDDPLSSTPVSSGITTSATAVATGLVPITAYDAYISSDCGSNGQSALVGPVSFTTTPINDDLANAIPLTMNAACTGNLYSTIASTSEQGENQNNCSTLFYGVWFSFTAPPGDVVVSTNFPATTNRTGIVAYPPPAVPGDANTLPGEIGCIEGLNPTSLNLSGLVPGNTYFVRVTTPFYETDYFCIEVVELADYVYSSGSWAPSDPSTDPAGPTDFLRVADGTASLTSALTVKRIDIESGATLKIEQALTVNTSIRNDGNLVFVNDATKLGQLNDMTGATISGNGEVTVQRYIPVRNDGKGAYRYLASAVNSTGSIHENWQENATGINDNPNPGHGIFITGSTTGANGFDQTAAGAPSMFGWDGAAQNYLAVPNTNVDNLVAGVPYVTYIWGDRGVDILSSNDPVATSTTLQATGNLVIDDQVITGLSSVPNAFNLVGNPYQAIVDMNDVLVNSVNLNTAFYYVWDPNLATRGAYALVLFNSGSTLPSTSGANQYLQPGQAAFVLTANNQPTFMVFEEGDKDISQTPTDVFRPQNVASIELQLLQEQAFNNGGPLSDALRVNFSAGESNAVMPNDAPKLWNFDETTALVNGNSYLAVENRALPIDGETLQLHNDQYRVSDYVFKALIENLPGNITAYLKDAYLNTQNPLNNNGETLVNFSVDESVPASIAPDRFSIVFAVNGLSTDAFAGENFTIYPNPVKGGNFFVLAPGLAGEEVQVSLYDLLGREVCKSLKTIGADNRAEIKTGNLQAGVYMVKMENKGRGFFQKLIVR